MHEADISRGLVWLLLQSNGHEGTRMGIGEQEGDANLCLRPRARLCALLAMHLLSALWTLLCLIFKCGLHHLHVLP